MRLAFALFVLLSACGSTHAKPAWPKMTEKETDGGESLAPRAKASAVAEASKSDKDDDDDKPKSDDKPAAKADDDDDDTSEDAPEAKASEPARPDSDDVIITTEEIVIEVEDD